MRRGIILERLTGEIKQNADTDHVNNRPFFIFHRGSFFRQTDRIRDGARVYVEWRIPKGPIVSTLPELIPSTNDSAENEGEKE